MAASPLPQPSPVLFIISDADETLLATLGQMGTPVYCLTRRIAAAPAFASAPAREPSPFAPDESSIDDMLRQLGIPAHISGRAYLADAIAMVARDETLLLSLTKRLYPEIARRRGVNAASVERGLRYAVEICWSRCAPGLLEKLFGNTTDPQRGKPTCGAFLTEVAHYLMRRAAFAQYTPPS